jgi:colanic acid/amylovoran biosynthesis glycosyltransferase
MYPRFSETFILNEILAHEAAGLEVHIFSLKLPSDGHFHEDLAKVRAPVTYLNNDSLRAVHFWQDIGKIGASNPLVWERLPHARDDDAHDVHAAVALAGHARFRGITHLHAHFATSAATVAMHAAAMSGIRYSFTAHAKDIYIDGLDHARIRRMMREAARVVTVSDFNVEHLQQTYGTDAANVTRIYNGLDLRRFPYTPPAKRERLVVGVGRLVEKKGFEDLINACGLLREAGEDIRCEIIGSGPLMSTLRALIQQRGLEGTVSLLGALPRERVIERVGAASVLAAPCVIGDDGNRDGLPTVLLEAMALGTPCVATDVTGIREAVVHAETGICTEQRDTPALARAIATLVNDPELRVRYASAARAHCEDLFDIERNSGLLRQVFTTPPASVPAPLEALGAGA